MTIWVVQEPTRRVNGQVISLFEREIAEKLGEVKMLVGSQARIEDPTVQKELWEKIRTFNLKTDKIILAGNTALIFAVGYIISAIHGEEAVSLLIYGSKKRINGELVQQPSYNEIILNLDEAAPDFD